MKSKDNKFSLFSPIIGFLFIFFGGIINPTDEAYMILPISILITTLLLLYKDSYNSNSSFLFIALIATGLIYTMNSLGIYIFMAIGVGILIIATNKKDQPSLVLNVFLLIGLLLVSLTSYSVDLIFGLISLLLSMTILIPMGMIILNKGGIKASRFDDAMYENKKPIMQVLIFVLIVLVGIVLAINSSNFNINVINYYESSTLNFTSNNLLNFYATLTIFIIIIIFGIMNVFISRHNKSHDYPYLLISVMLLINPITIGSFSTILNIGPAFTTNVMLIVPFILLFSGINIKNIEFKK
jgi:cytochrome c oxidase subunit IV